MQMDRDVQVVVILLTVIAVGGLLMWAIRRKASAWADQYDKAAADERRGVEADYPVIGYRAQRLSWWQAILLVVIVAIGAVVVAFLQWLFEWATS